MGFTGFPDEAFEFFAGLAEDNSKAYWEANRATYESTVKGPLQALLDEFEPEFGTGKIFRIHRDVRFSKDKSPYKTQQGAHAAGGCYLQLDADGLMVAGGMYGPSSEQIARYRAAVDEEKSGQALVAIVGTLRAEGFEIAGEMLKTRPRGVPDDHPRLELLRHRSLYAHRGWPADPWMRDGPQVLDRVRSAWRKLTPIVEWGTEHMGGNERLS
ncbi:MAG TPA: DUF2461 domain-containing protein [Streptosporangiaceae bacterium]|nr:DUF2461 domain-containing protein [Streptosporangiaceae bacterium]